MDKYVTHISLDDFRKLGLKGWRHILENGQSCFVDVDLAEEIKKRYNSNFNLIIVAIHEEPSRDQIEYLKEEANMTEADAFDFSLYNNCYTVPGEGYQTYKIALSNSHLKSTRDYFENEDVKINKRVTKSVYEIQM